MMMMTASKLMRNTPAYSMLNCLLLPFISRKLVRQLKRLLFYGVFRLWSMHVNCVMTVAVATLLSSTTVMRPRNRWATMSFTYGYVSCPCYLQSLMRVLSFLPFFCPTSTMLLLLSYAFRSHSWSARQTASSSAECSLDKPPCSLVCGQDSTMCDIVWVSPQEHRSESDSFHFVLQAPLMMAMGNDKTMIEQL